jgi:multiple sugar transport system permease protein
MSNDILSGQEAVSGQVSNQRMAVGAWMVRLATFGYALLVLLQTLTASGVNEFGFSSWLPVFLGFGVWGVFLCWGNILRLGEQGWRALFVLPAILLTVAMVIFPTFFGLYIAFSDWNLSSATGQHFNGLANFYQLLADERFWNALSNMIFYVATVIVQYAIAFGLALLLNSEIRGQKFFRVAFLLPFMLSPVAVSWMIGKSMLEFRFGPVTNLLRSLGWENPSLLTTPWLAKATLAAMDAWVWIPFMMILLLAGLQAMSKEVQEAAKVDGASGWQGFWHVTYPLMLQVSMTTVILRIISTPRRVGPAERPIRYPVSFSANTRIAPTSAMAPWWPKSIWC